MQSNDPLSLLYHTIDTALTSENTVDRPNAEANIIQYRDSNPAQFFLDCSIIIASPNFKSEQKQQVGTVASRLINMKYPDADRFYWDDIQPEVKVQIKENVLSVLVNPQEKVMRTAASIVAGIASIELPRNEWEEIVDLLAQNINNQDVNIKNASITIMGYICEQIKNVGKSINNHLSQQILGSIILGARQGGAYMKTSLKALEDSMQFLSGMLQDSKYREPVFQVFIQNFKRNLDMEELQETYNALYEFAKTCSRFLGSYSQALIDLTRAHVEQKGDGSSLNLQLWEVIGSDYNEKQNNLKDRINEEQVREDNFLQSVSPHVLPIIIKSLIVQNGQDEEETKIDDPIKSSALRALEAFAKVCDRSVVDTITSSVSTLISDPDPNYQQATVPLFSTICEYEDINYVKDMFRNGFEHLFGLVGSQSKMVIRNTLAGFVRLAQMLPDVFLHYNNLNQFIDKIFEFMAVPDHDARLKAVEILANMSEGLKENPLPVCDNPEILLTKIVQFYSSNMEIFHKEQPQMNEKVITVILNIVMNSNKRDIMIQLIQFMMEEYNKIVTSQMKDTNYLLEQILCVLHTAILAHKNNLSNNDLMLKLCQLIDFHINKFGIEQQGLSLMGAMATTFGRNFEVRAGHYWKTVVSVGLLKVNEAATFKAALNCVGDFARMMESCFMTEAMEVMQTLMKYIQQNLDREVKLCIIGCMGDLILSLQESSSTFIDQLVNILDLSFSAVYQLTPNPQDLDYVEDLKFNLIELYSCVVFSVNQKKVSPTMFDHFGNLATFIVRTCNKELHPTIEYLKNCLYLLYDSAAFYSAGMSKQRKEKITSILDSGEVKQLIGLIEKFSNRPEIKELLDFITNQSHNHLNH